MKVVFVFYGIGHTKVYGALIEELLLQSVNVECWLDQKDISGSSKAYDFPNLALFPKFKNGSPTYRTFIGKKQFVALVDGSSADVIFSHFPLPAPNGEGPIRGHIVSAFVDSMCIFTAQQMIDGFDFISFNTEEWIDLGMQYYRDLGALTLDQEAQLRKKCVALGSPQYDHFLFCSRDRFREKHGLPLDRPVVTVYGFETSATFWSQRILYEGRLWMRLFYVLVLPFSYPYVYGRLGLRRLPYALLRSLWERLPFLIDVFRTPSEESVLKSLREFCDRNGAVLLAKFRKKNPVRACYRKYADHIIEEDTEYLPYTSAQVIHSSDLVVLFYSSAVAECVYARTPVVSLAPRVNARFIDDQYQFLKPGRWKAMGLAEARFYNLSPGGLYQFPGAVKGVAVDEFVRRLGQLDLGEFRISDTARESYVHKHINSSTKPASQRIVEYLRQRLAAH